MFAVYYTFNTKRVESPTAPNWNSSSAEAVLDLKISSLGLKAKQQKRRKFRESSCIIQSEIHPNGQLLVVEQNFQAVRMRSDKTFCRREIAPL